MGESVFLRFLAFLSTVTSLRIASSSRADPTFNSSILLTGAVTLSWLLGKKFVRVCRPKPPEGTLPEGASNTLQPFLDGVKKLGELEL